MKNITNFFMAVAFLCSTALMAQSTVSGVVVDDTNMPLPGVNVIEKGTTNGVTTDFDGNFTLTTKTTDATIVISYIGFVTKEIEVSGDQNLETIALEPSEFGLDEVRIIASVAVDRKTPVAVSTIRADEIELKLGTQEFPEVLKSTPGVYATKAGGGFGDGRINLRGFDSENVAVMINGVPVNDMENGRVYWSNWAGLGDVTSSMQVQRGLGASKVAVPSIGGTINILSKTTDVEQGGNFYTTLGNDGYKKFGFTYSTGLSDKGFAATVSAAKTDGDGYVDGTEFNAVSYFINLSKEFNDAHKISFTAFGAKQRHGQRQNRHTLDTYRNSERGRKFNSDWGYKNGQVTYQEDNFYHKPQISLNHYWTISDKTSLSTAAYASFGSGGGGGFRGDNKFIIEEDGSSDYRIGNYGPINFDKIVQENIDNGNDGSETILRASRNDHRWYGVLSTLKTDLTDNLVLLGGLDWRSYKGIHFNEVTDLLGGQYFLDNRDKNNPNNKAQVGDKIAYYNDGLVGWLGGFAQLEYDKDALSAFVSIAASNTSYQRVDYFNYLDSDPLQESAKFNFAGYSVKGGANYRLNDYHNVFANLGYFEKAPIFRSVFPNFNNEDVNGDAENQKITSFELGYGLRGEKFTANVNLYHTRWDDRTELAGVQLQDGTQGYANILGVSALHKGIELDFVYRATDKLKFTGMASFGDWKWLNDVTDVPVFDDLQNQVATVNLFIKDLHVGDAAQTTLALGMNWEIFEGTKLLVDYNYYDRLFADFNPSDRNDPLYREDAWELPAYGLFDVGLRHKFEIGDIFNVELSGRINNLFDTEYVSDAQDNANSTTRANGQAPAEVARGWFGAGRTFNVGAKFKF